VFHHQLHLLNFAMETMLRLMDLQQVHAQIIPLVLLTLVQHSAQKQEHMNGLDTNKKKDINKIKRICGLEKNNVLDRRAFQTGTFSDKVNDLRPQSGLTHIINFSTRRYKHPIWIHGTRPINHIDPRHYRYLIQTRPNLIDALIQYMLRLQTNR